MPKFITSALSFLKSVLTRTNSLRLKMLWYLRIKVLPLVLRTLKLLFHGVVIALILILAIRNRHIALTSEYKELFSAMASTSGTVVAIFFSLVLIPFNQISSRYSPRFFKYLKNDQTFLIFLSYSIACVAFDVTFLLSGSNRGIATAGVIAFIYLFVLLGGLWRHTVYLSDPRNSVLDPEFKRIVKQMKKQIPAYRKATAKSLARLSKNSEKSSIDLSYSKVDDRVIAFIKESLLPMREIAIKAIKNGELELAKHTIGVMTAVTLNYLQLRKKYYSDDDPLMYFVYTEFTLLMKTSNNELKLQLHPFLVDCWRNIGIYCSSVNIKGLPRMNNNVNNLVAYPIKALNELTAENAAESDSTAPGDACKAMADIGVSLMHEGYDQQAMHIVQELAKISIAFDMADIGVFSGSANYAIMRIYAAGLGFRNAAAMDGHDYAFRTLHEAVDQLLISLLRMKRDTFAAMVLNPFIGWLTDPFTGINIARTTEIALFSDNLSEYSLEMNMAAVERLLETLKKAIRKLEDNDDDYWGGQAYENLYLVVLDLLSYINPTMAPDHILYMKQEPFKSSDLLEKADDFIINAFDFLLEMAEASGDHMMPGRNVMDIVASLYFVFLYEKRRTNSARVNQIYLQVHRRMVEFLNTYTTNGTANNNAVITKYFRLIKLVLSSNNHHRRANELNVPPFQFGRGFDGGLFFDSEFPEAIIGRHWSITRPIFQKNAHYWSLLENDLGLRDD